MISHVSWRELRAARVLAGLTIQELADISGVSKPTIQRVETKGGRRSSIDAIAEALRTKGIVFLESGGVRMGEPRELTP